MEFIPWTSFVRIVDRYGGDFRVRSLSCPDQFRAMSFAQLTYRESLHNIEMCFLANQTKLYSMGFRSPIRRSTLADANEGRDWRIWVDLAALLMRRAGKLYCNDSFGIYLDNTVYLPQNIVDPRSEIHPICREQSRARELVEKTDGEAQ